MKIDNSLFRSGFLLATIPLGRANSPPCASACCARYGIFHRMNMMPEGLLGTRQVNALRTLLERRDFSAEDVAALDYHVLARMPGIGGKSLNIIRGWLASRGLDLHNSPDEYSRSLKYCRLEARLARARVLLEKHGYRVFAPTRRP